jgi:hypothetical protein
MKKSDKIIPMKRRRFGVSRTAPQGITDVVLTVGNMSKFKAIRLLRAAGVKNHKLLR